MSKLPELTPLHVTSAISQFQISSDVPTIMAYDQPITIHAQPKTDLWRKPPTMDVDNAPTLLISTPIDIHKFQSARVTVSADWNTLYDQGGLVFFIPGKDGTTGTWMKTGIEFYGGKPFVGSVFTTHWSDWALVPMAKEKGGKLTVQVERQVKEGKKLDSLWIYVVDEATGEKMLARQNTSWFTNDNPDPNATSDNRCLMVGIYAARPTVPTGEGREHEKLPVKLEGFKVQLFED